MPEYSLSTYYLHIKKKRKAGRCQLSDFDDGHDLFATLDGFFSRLQTNLTHDQHERRLIQVAQVRRDDKARIIEGVIKTGEYGFEAELIDANSAQLSYRRRVRDAEIYPFYFLVEIPLKNDTGFILLQRFRQFGIRRILHTRLDDFFRANHDNFILTMTPVLAPEVLATLNARGELHAIHVIKYTLPADKADALRVPREEASVDYVVRGKRHDILGRLKELVLGSNSFRIAELENLVPQFDTVKLEVELDGIKRSVDLSRPKLRTTFDLTNRVASDPSGHPSFEDMSREAKNILHGLRTQLDG